MDEYDVVVVGGGAAGLGGALALARARRSVLVIDAGTPRNAPAGHVHNYLGREATPPGELYGIGRAEVRSYGGEIVTGTAVAAERGDDGFRLVLDDGTAMFARRLLVTTGLVDELPQIPGLADRWGRDVLHCPYCHGWEVRDQPVGIIATGPLAVHQALMWRQWTDDVTLFLHTEPAPTDAESEQLAARDVVVVEGKVTGVAVSGDRLSGVTLADGRTVPIRAVVAATRMTARASVLSGLGLDAAPQYLGDFVIGTAIPADANGATAVPGVWVAGNVADLRAQVIVAAGAGLTAAAAINADLIADDTARAVAARRAG